jgi:hypothetical protein
LVVAGGFALVGVVVGQWSERRRQTTAWFRDNRLAAHVALLKAMAGLQGATFNLRNERDAETQQLADAAVDGYSLASMTMNQAVSRALLLCSHDIRPAINAFQYEIVKLYEATDDNDWDAMDAAQQALGPLFAQVRNELRIDLTSSPKLKALEWLSPPDADSASSGLTDDR